MYQSPPAQHQTDVPSASYVPQGSRRPSGLTFAEERDPKSGQSVRLGSSTHTIGGTVPLQRQHSRRRLPFLSPRIPEDDPRAQPLQNARSMSSLRASSSENPVSRQPYQAIPSRSGNTPAPSGGSLEIASVLRNASSDRVQDGRYPNAIRSAPLRAPPLQIPSTADTLPLMTFPSPHPGNPDAGASTWYGSSTTPAPANARRSPYDQVPPSPHVQTVRPSPTSPETATILRLMPFEAKSPVASPTIADEGYPASAFTGWRPRSRESTSSAYRSTSPVASKSRRATESGVEDRSDTQLPYVRSDLSPEQSWLSIPRSNRRDTSDTASVAGTVSSGFSEATVRPRTASVASLDGEEGDTSNDTARAGDFANQPRWMVEHKDTTGALDEEDDDGATLFLPKIRPSPSRPNLKVDTASVVPNRKQAGTPSDSATESESENRISRAKSFARPKDQPEQWHVRPEPEQLYEHLDNFFPKIDLDRPIVEGGPSTPSTPSSRRQAIPQDSQRQQCHPGPITIDH